MIWIGAKGAGTAGVARFAEEMRVELAARRAGIAETERGSLVPESVVFHHAVGIQQRKVVGPTETIRQSGATCGESATHDQAWQAEVWADIHEFEHSRHRVRLFEQTRAEGLKEIADWRDTCA